MQTTVRLPQFGRDAQVRSDSFDADRNTIDIVWTTGATVRRYDYWDGSEYDEVLSLEPGAVRLDRLNAGAPFLDTHCSYGLDNVIGSVVPGSASVKDGQGTAKIQLSKAPGVADTVQKISEGVIRNVSVGYWTHKIVKTEADDGVVARWNVTDWEPLEISAVPIPADAGSQIRSEQQGDGPQTRSCVIITQDAAAVPTSTPSKGKRMASAKTKIAAKRSKTPAELDAEKRAAAVRASKRDDEEDKKKDDDEEGDDTRDDDADMESAAEDADDKDDDADDKRDGDDDKDEERADDVDDNRSASAEARRAAEAAVKAERIRTAKITEMAERAGLPKLGKRHVAEGTSAKRFGELVLERMLVQQEKRGGATVSAAETPEVGGQFNGAPPAGNRDLEKGAAEARALLGIK